MKRSRSRLTLERKLYTREYALNLDRNLCIGCGICSEVCPKNVITLVPASVKSGRLIQKPTVDFEADKCIMCGICGVLCPLNAIETKVDGQESAQFVKQNVFPTLLKNITIHQEMCRPECGLACQDACPRKAIKVVTEKLGAEGRIRIADVQVDKKLCVYCKRCEVACPLNVIYVEKPFKGTVEVIQELCTKDCQACIDICPSRAIERDIEGKLRPLDQFCFYCSACEKVCPNEAIKVSRNAATHSDVKSGIWLTALKNLTSFEAVSRELTLDSQKKRHSTFLSKEMLLLPE